MDKQDYQILDETILHQGFLTVKKLTLKHRLFAGGWSNVLTRELLVRQLAVVVLPYDPQTDQVVLIEQFRPGALSHPVSPWLVELVAGLAEPDETPEAVALRETKEEAGLEVLELMPIIRYLASPGGSIEDIVLYCAKVNAKNAAGIHGLANENEDIKVQTVTSAEAFAAVHSGKICSASAIIALQWLELNVHKLREKWC